MSINIAPITAEAQDRISMLQSQKSEFEEMAIVLTKGINDLGKQILVFSNDYSPSGSKAYMQLSKEQKKFEKALIEISSKIDAISQEILYHANHT